MPIPPAGHHAGPDACPGALRLHAAADGALARVRVPAGLLTSGQLATLTGLAARLGDGHLELTSRGNLQLRGLVPDAGATLATELAAAGLLPSLAHERVRNIVASPLGDHAVATELDRALCADPALAALPGRFLFAVDDGRGDVLPIGADVTALGTGGGYSVLLAGHDCGLRATPAGTAALMAAAARAFLAERGAQEGVWRIRELAGGPAVVARRLGSTVPPVRVDSPQRPLPVGVLTSADGRPALGALVPLGRLTPAQLTALAAVPEIVVTPWRGVVLPGAVDPEPLATAGLVLDPASPWAGVTTCAGLPGCAKARADVRAEASATLVPGELPVHWIGCERGCGSPAGEFVQVLATGSGYRVSRSGHVISEDDPVAPVLAAARTSP